MLFSQFEQFKPQKTNKQTCTQENFQIVIMKAICFCPSHRLRLALSLSHLQSVFYMFDFSVNISETKHKVSFSCLLKVLVYTWLRNGFNPG